MLLLALGLFSVVTLYWIRPELQGGFWSGLFVEFNGMLFDIVVFGVLISLFMRATERRREVRRQQEIVDDYKKWDSEEARFRIAGAIRRLIELGRTDIDFGGIELTDFSFRRHDIKSIKGSVFYDGTWGEMGSRDNVVLDRVSFSSLDCRAVVFSRFNPFVGFKFDVVFASIKDCSFVEADLSGAVFNGAHMEWTTEHPAKLGEWEESIEGPPAFHQTHYPPFSNANLKGASFVDTRFRNADFRQAEGLRECDFTGAKGLETCLFDGDETKRTVLAMSQQKEGKASARVP